MKKFLSLLVALMMIAPAALADVDAENGATAGKFELAKLAKQLNLDAIHDTVHEMARDEARHGREYENPIQHACDMEEGQVFIANGWEKPEGFCQSAWDTLSPFVLALSHGGGDFYDGWMKNKKSAMLSCNDGFRPVSFYVEALEEDAE